MNRSTITQLPRIDLVRVDEVMHVGLIGCDPSTPLPAIAKIFAQERIHSVVVHGIERTREGERLTWGILSERDLVRAIDSGDGSVTAGELAMPAEPTIDVAEELDLAAKLMSSYDVSHLVVVDKNYPVGVISALDIAAAASGV